MRSYSQLIRHPGNHGLFEAIELSLLATMAGLPLHLHAEGLRGTGKTTIIRSVRSILPAISRIKGCAYNCDPQAPHCPEHSRLTQDEIAALGTEQITVPFLEISHSAKVGTVAGSIDLARLTAQQGPEAAVLPGTLARAHRGIVFVDEINRLADTSPELTDILLDAMGTRPGRLQIEEAGMATVELPLKVSVWAASNPDEDPGPLEDIRRQLSDRFDLHAAMGRIRSREVLMELLQSDHDAIQEQLPSEQGIPAGSHQLSATTNAPPCRYPAMIQARAAKLRAVWLPAAMRQAVAELYLECNLESLRTVEATQIAARAACAWRGGESVSPDDLRRAVPLVLGRRVDPEAVARFLARLGQDGVIRPLTSPQAQDGAGGAGRSGLQDVPTWHTRASSQFASSPGQQSYRTAADNPESDGAGGLRAPGHQSSGEADSVTDGQSHQQGHSIRFPEGLQNTAPRRPEGTGGRRSWLGRLLRPLLAADGSTGAGLGSPDGGGTGTQDGSRLNDGRGGNAPCGLPPSAPPTRARPLVEIPLPEVLRIPGSESNWHED